jgi:phosphoribosylanthranilate isomerase
MPTRVKICGITRQEDAELSVELGASALGFNFYPPSPRYLAPVAARQIIRRLPPFVLAVGIFADETDAERVAAIAREAKVGAVQLHGPLYPIPAPSASPLDDFRIIRAVAVSDGFRPEDLKAVKASAYLLDTFSPELPGGTGKTFDWQAAREAKKYGPIILAGGLTPDNVGRAIREVRPLAVDVASGVESAPGVKDPSKLRAFFVAVAAADKELNQ